MARTKRTPEAKRPADPWAGLTWDHLGRSFDAGSIRRGRDYQSQKRVTDLRVAEGGATLLATVRGGESYGVRVDLDSKSGTPLVTSLCTCFVGFCCKHGVAAVAEYLQAVAEGRAVPPADPDDPRWEELEAEGDEAGEPFDEGDDPFGADEDEAEFLLPAGRPRRQSSKGKPKPKRQSAGERAIEEHVRGRPASELADLVLALAGRIPAVAEELREQVALAKGDATHLLKEAKQIIRQLKSERNGYYDDEADDEPPFGRLGSLFEKLLTLGMADEVVVLGREYIPLGIHRTIETVDSEDWSLEFADSLPVIFRALGRSSLSGSERLLVAIDAILADDYDLVGSAAGLALDGPARPEDWSGVADALLRRLAKTPPARRDAFADSYARENLVKWITRALEAAGRGDERIALAEAEAEASGSFEPLVDLLLEAGRPDDAARWAARGIAATAETWPGIARHLADRLLKLAQDRQDWPEVAAHRAWAFFAEPGRATWDALMADARRAGSEGPVRQLAQGFLETGVAPVRLVAEARPRVAPAVVAPAGPKGRGKAKGKAGSGRVAPTSPKAEPPGEPTLAIAEGWPLPVPAALVPLLPRPDSRLGAGPGPRYDVLVDLAIARNQPEEVLRWFDRASAERPDGRAIDPDRVAAAVAASHPERALEIYTVGLSRALPRAEPSAYEAVAGYLRRLRPIYDATGRPDEWAALVASIRLKHKNRPRLIEALDRLDGQTILDEAKKRAEGR